MRWIRFVLTSILLLGACTQPSLDETPPSGSGDPTGSPSAAAGARLPDGTPLPAGCIGGADASHTVAFVADGRAWALDPDDGDLGCLFPVEDAGPFAWGPQGDRVLLDGFEIRGIGGDAPDLPAIDTSVSAFDWGHPLGLAVVFADVKGIPRKRFVDDGRLVRLGSLPPGKYLQVAYHPSGLALAFVVRTSDGQEIWLSTNEGEDPQRLVFSERGTEFTSLAFSPNGRTLWWTAQHEEGYPELHFMKLENRTGFGTSWRGTEGAAAAGLRLAPAGSLRALTEGTTCEERTALVLSRRRDANRDPRRDATDGGAWVARPNHVAGGRRRLRRAHRPVRRGWARPRRGGGAVSSTSRSRHRGRRSRTHRGRCRLPTPRRSRRRTGSADNARAAGLAAEIADHARSVPRLDAPVRTSLSDLTGPPSRRTPAAVEGKGRPMPTDMGVTVEDSPGGPADVGEALGNAGINIEGLCGVGLGDQGGIIISW